MLAFTSVATFDDDCQITSISGLEEAIAVLSAATITSSITRYKKGDIKTLNPITVEFVFNQNKTADTSIPGPGTDLGTVVLTFAKVGNEATAAKLSGSAFSVSRTGPTVQNDQIMTGQFVFHFDGVTGPTYAIGA